jgi:probable addiction module antidote protein
MPSVTLKTTKRAKQSAAPTSVSHEEWLIERLKNPKEAAAYIEAAIEENDQSVLMLALRQVAQAQGGVAAIAAQAGMTREATYRMLSDKGNPELKSFTAILAAAGLKLSVKPMRRTRQKAA